MSDEFRFEWFSGTGKGGQHRNKHQNCCRCTHTPTGIQANGTSDRSREANKRAALSVCKSRVAAYFHEDTERFRASSNRVRTYHAERNEILDHASGARLKYSDVVSGKKDFGPLIEARAMSVRAEPVADGVD